MDGDIARFDLGTSLWTGNSVVDEIQVRFPLSLELAFLATLLAIAIAIPLGVLAAVRQDTWVDYVIRVFSIGGLAMPSFWIGILMILTTLTLWGWAPPLVFTPFSEDPVANLAQLILPAIAVGYRYSAVSMRMTRSTVLEVLREDYVRTARAKGLRESLVVMRHALRNALLPVITVISLEFAFLIGGLVVTEQVFNLNGIGKLLVDAVAHRDYTLIQAIVLLLAAVFVFINFLVDMVYVVLDPRIATRDRLPSGDRARCPRERYIESTGSRRFLRFWREFLTQRPLGAAGAVLIILMLVAAAGAGLIAPYEKAVEIHFSDLLLPPSSEHILGTDHLGRDVFVRIIYGSRTALLVGFVASFVGCTLGLVLGVVGAYFGGRADQIIQRLMDVLISFPLIVIAIAVVAALGTGEDKIGNVIAAITVPIIPRVARVVRSSALSIVNMPYIEATRSVGSGAVRIMFKHVAPNVFAPYLIMLTAFLAQAILLEASLSFLGLGVFEPTPSWGLMLRGAGTQFLEQAPWIAIAPGVAISLAVFGFNLFGDSLRDALDPRLRTA